MNINLLSPKQNNNGFSYNVRFRENIDFPKNSKVYLNYCKVSRESAVFFSEDQTISLTNLELLPTHKPGTPASVNTPTNISITIPKKDGGYEFDELQETITDGLNTLTTQNEMKIYTAFDDDTGHAINEENVGIGYYNEIGKSVGIDIEEFVGSAANSVNAGADEHNVYFKNNASGVKTSPTYTFGYDSYSLSTEHFFHPMKLSKEENTTSFIEFETNVPQTSQQGGICIGLYSEEYIEPIVGGNNANRTEGNATTTSNGTTNPQVIKNSSNPQPGSVDFLDATPACFLSVEITPPASAGVDRGALNDAIIVRCARRTAALNSSVDTWTDINQNIVGMRRLRTSKIANHFDGTIGQFRGAIQTYYTNEDANLPTANRKLYFRVLSLNKSHDTNDPNNLIYDSRKYNIFFPMSFFTGLAIAGNDAQKKSILESQIPFNVICAAQAQNEGFSNVQFMNIDKDEGTDNNPLSIIMNYKLSFSEELSRYIGASTSHPLFPNSAEDNEETFIFIKNFHLDWFNDSYSILLKNLPIRNFKNTNKESNGGFGKAILATIPIPFQNTIEQMDANKRIITGIYQPSFPIMLELKNNPFQLNNFDISIVNTETEEEVKEIIKSNISFTITQ